MTHHTSRRGQAALAITLAAASGVTLTALLFPAAAVQTRTAAASLSAADCVAFAEFEGTRAREDAFEKSAAYEAFIASGFGERLDAYARRLVETAGRLGGPLEADQIAAVARLAREAAGLVAAEGGAVALYLPAAEDPPPGTFPARPVPVVLLNNYGAIADFLTRADAELQDVFGAAYQLAVTVSDEQIVLAEAGPPGAERDRVVLKNVGERALVLAEGFATDVDVAAYLRGETVIAGHPKYPADADGFLTAFADLDRLRGIAEAAETDGPLAPRDFLAEFDFDLLHAFRQTSRFEGRGVRGVLRTDVGERPGTLFSADVTPPFTLADLPPLPAGVAGFTFSSLDGPALYGRLVERIKALEAKAGEDDFSRSYAQFVGQFTQVAGRSPEELLAAFGPVVGGYDEPMTGGFSVPTVLVARVRDAGLVRDVFDRVRPLLEQQAGDDAALSVEELDGYSVLSVAFAGSPFSLQFGLSEDWLAVSASPYGVDEFFARVADPADVWRPTEAVLAGNPGLSGEMVSLAYTDTAGTWRTGLTYLPSVVAMAGGAAGFAIPQPRLPRPAKITDPLFPNVAVTTRVEGGLETRSFGSGPPLPGGLSRGASLPTVAVGVAVLLPAVQQAREAARRTQCKNNLKMLALSAMNYESTYNHLPAGTIAGSAEKPEDRLAWTVSVLPHLGDFELHDKFDKTAGWAEEPNASLGRENPQATFLCPSNPEVATADGFPVAHYAAVAGFGNNAPTDAATAAEAGLTAYDRGSSIRDARDGMSNTILYMELGGDFGPWTSGGAATVRPSTGRPPVNGPDGFGSTHPGGAQAAMGDGRVVFLSDAVDPDLFRALTTRAAGDDAGGF